MPKSNAQRKSLLQYCVFACRVFSLSLVFTEHEITSFRWCSIDSIALSKVYTVAKGIRTGIAWFLGCAWKFHVVLVASWKVLLEGNPKKVLSSILKGFIWCLRWCEGAGWCYIHTLDKKMMIVMKPLNLKPPQQCRSQKPQSLNVKLKLTVFSTAFIGPCRIWHWWLTTLQLGFRNNRIPW